MSIMTTAEEKVSDFSRVHTLQDMEKEPKLRCGKANYYQNQTCPICGKEKTWQYFKKCTNCLQCRNVISYHKYMESDGGERMQRQRDNAKNRYAKKKLLKQLEKERLQEKATEEETSEEQLI